MATITPDTRVPTRPLDLPTRAQVRAAIPDECFRHSLPRSFAYLGGSALAVAVPATLAALYLPMTWAWLPVWLVYAVVTGTAATGLWVIAHECGHGAFARQARLQDTIGYVLHTALLVPYFSWQRSHSVHHAKTNHLDEGETHVPARAEDPRAVARGRLRERLGEAAFAGLTLVRTLLFGWPAYLLAGVTGGPARGRSNHFWPVAPFATELFPKRWHGRVWASTAGIVAMLGVLAGWAIAAGSIVPVLALYVGPYLVVNAWLVTYTWLQHTGDGIPHFDEHEWTWLRGAFQTVDRPYGRVVDVLHHRIGTTHVAHHIDSKIPHYRAATATEAIRREFPAWYRYDPTPVPVALWRVARDCVAVEEHVDGWHPTSLADVSREPSRSDAVTR